MKKWFFFILFSVAVSLLWLPLDAGSQGQKSKHSVDVAAASGAEQKVSYPSMPGPGKKVSIGNDYYLVYGFDKKPKLGTVIMKVEVFAKDGKKDTSFELKADSDMPSMKGAHGSGDRPFKLSKKGDYLLPIDIVMPAGWEIKLTLLKAGKIIYTGSYKFDV